MNTFREFLYDSKVSKKDAIEARNKALDIDKLVADALKNFSGKRNPTKDEIKSIADYMKSRMTFSLGKMSDELDEIPVGWLKKAIEVVKDEIDKKGFGKKGVATKPLTQPERSDRFLKQKPVGLIKRKK